MPLAVHEFATKAGLDSEIVSKISRLGLIPDVDALEDAHIPVARLVAELDRSGVSLEQLAGLVADGSLSLDNIDRGFIRSAAMLRGNFEGLAAELGVSSKFAEGIRLALGVPGSGDETLIREDDAAVLSLLAEMVDLGVDEPVVVNLFQVMTDNLRKMARAASEMWNDGVLQPLLGSGMPFREIVVAQSLNGERLQDIGVGVVSTVWRRYLDDEVFSGAAELLERALSEVGLERSLSARPPAIAFMDLTAFTAMTDRQGDDAAAAGARDLRNIVRKTLVARGGTLVKMLGDGAMLHFADATTAVECALDLTETIPAQGLPPARFGIEAGPVIVRDVDFFGQTVNVAARLVDYARPREVLVTARVVEAAEAGRIRFAEIGPVSLRGVADLVQVFSASTDA